MITKTKPFEFNPGTVSEGTMRPEDLIPAFADVLFRAPLNDADRSTLLALNLRRRKGENYYDTDGADFDLEWLFDVLGEYAPADHYFGAHPGDGADYGFWACEDGE